MYGLSEDIILKECRISMNTQRALLTSISEGLYQYVGIQCGLSETLRVQVQAEMDQVNAGEGNDVVKTLMDWVQRVRLRALYDLAACHAMTFTSAWTIV